MSDFTPSSPKACVVHCTSEKVGNGPRMPERSRGVSMGSVRTQYECEAISLPAIPGP